MAGVNAVGSVGWSMSHFGVGRLVRGQGKERRGRNGVEEGDERFL